ncbi:MAG TPA: GntP family permease [Burkholderiaceae bacterium]|jgi:H+/gluconate symporter-like permease|nr:GntP family permease [Burkholderiaceae bacterium]
MTAVAILGICLSLGLLMYLAYRGINVLLLAPLMALLAVVFNGGMGAQLLGTYTQLFMVELGKYLAKFFPLFMLGALFGKVMDDSGSAKVIAQQIARWAGSRQAILAIVLACGVLTYGGVSLFVVAFAVYPIAKSLFREQDIPKRLIPGAIALGSFTFTMTALPGTPAIQNAIPTAYFGTTPFAAPGLGTIGGLIMFLGGMLWLNRRAHRAHEAGEGYGQHSDQSEVAAAAPGTANPGFTVALIPIVLVIGLNFVFTRWLIPSIDTSFLSQPKYGGIKVGAVAGIWSIVLAVACATVVAFIANRRRLANIADTINKGTLGSMLPVMNTASEVGYGGVVASLPAFAAVRDSMTSLTSDPVVSIAITVNVLAAVTGSASGGLSIAMASLGDYYLKLAQAAHVSPEIMHRIASMSSGGFDCMPHNGAVITLLAICGLTHRESYFDIFVVASGITVIAGICVIIVNAMFGTF